MNKAACFLILIISTLVISCRKDAVEVPKGDECPCFIDATAQDYFRNDSEGLAYQEIVSDVSHDGYNEIELDEETVQFYLCRLSAIYQSAIDTSSEVHNMIFKYHVHQGERVMLDELVLKFTDSSSLYYQLIDDPAGTDNVFLNELYSLHDFNPAYHSETNYSVIIKSQENYNVRLIIETLEEDPNIINVYPSLYFLDGESITYTKYDEYVEFIFGFGWGDCPSGCFAHHYWTIRVDNSYNVELIDEFGDELPE